MVAILITTFSGRSGNDKSLSTKMEVSHRTLPSLRKIALRNLTTLLLIDLIR